MMAYNGKSRHRTASLYLKNIYGILSIAKKFRILREIDSGKTHVPKPTEQPINNNRKKKCDASLSF